MSALVLKLNATGDVVRTTTLLHHLASGHVTWITAAPNADLLAQGPASVRCLEWSERDRALDRRYDLVINLEDDLPAAQFVGQLQQSRLFGAFLDGDGSVSYSEDSRRWFDLSLISRFGRQRADELKLLNRCTYQDLIFDGLGLTFAGETYVLPPPAPTSLAGDVAIASVAALATSASRTPTTY